jgi:hypothetical protein
MHKFFTEDGASYGLCNFFCHDSHNVENAVNIGAVSSKLQFAKRKKQNGVFIGVVDNDKRKQSFFETFTIVSNKEGVILKQLGNLYLIVLAPQVDGFIFTNAGEKNVDLSKYSFSTDKKKFVRSLKTTGIEGKSNFKSLLNDLKQKKCSCFIALQEAFDFIYSQK